MEASKALMYTGTSDDSLMFIFTRSRFNTVSSEPNPLSSTPRRSQTQYQGNLLNTKYISGNFLQIHTTIIDY